MGKGNKKYKKDRNYHKKNPGYQMNRDFNNKSDNRREREGKFTPRRNGSKNSNSYSSNSYNSNNGKSFSRRERNNFHKETKLKIDDYFVGSHKKREQNNFENKNDKIELEIINEDSENSLNHKDFKKDKSTQTDEINNKLIEDYNSLKEKYQKLEEFTNEKIDEADRMKKEISRKNDIIEELKNKEDKLNIRINSLVNDINNVKNIKEDLVKKYNEQEKEIIQNNKIMEHIKKVNPLIIYIKPTLIGLNNIGATCFMNSTLQCLSQTKDLTSYFLNEKNKDKIINNNIAIKNNNDYQLSPIFLDLIQKLWEIDGPKSFSPNTFMNTINNMNPLFKTGQAGDAKDFIIFVLEQLHKELKQSININIQDDNGALNQYDKNNAFNYFFNDFRKETSIISDIFFGFNEITNECLYCKNIYNAQGLNSPICYNYGIFNCLIFPLEEVKNMKNMQNNYINNRVSIYDCFFYNQKSDYFTGDNRNYCNICKQLYI